MTTPQLRLDRNLDGSGELYAWCPGGPGQCPQGHDEHSAGHDVLITTMTPGQVREFRQMAAPDRIPDPAQDN